MTCLEDAMAQMNSEYPLTLALKFEGTDLVLYCLPNAEFYSTEPELHLAEGPDGTLRWVGRPTEGPDVQIIAHELAKNEVTAFLGFDPHEFLVASDALEDQGVAGVAPALLKAIAGYLAQRTGERWPGFTDTDQFDDPHERVAGRLDCSRFIRWTSEYRGDSIIRVVLESENGETRVLLCTRFGYENLLFALINRQVFDFFASGSVEIQEEL